MSVTDELEHYMTACSRLKVDNARLQTALTEAERQLRDQVAGDLGEYLEVVQVYALGHRVLVVGVQRVDGWRAYCDAVPGINHDRECKEVARNGDKLPEEVARAILGTRNLTGPYCP